MNMILELKGTKVFIVDGTLGYQGDNLVNTIQVTVDKDSTWNYKLDMYKGKSKCFDSVLMTREGNTCTVQLTNEILSYGGEYLFQLKGYTDTQTYHSDIFESWVNASIEYQDDCKQTDCRCLPTEFHQVEDNVIEINNHPPYPGDNGKWMIWNVDKHEYVESNIDVIGGKEPAQFANKNGRNLDLEDIVEWTDRLAVVQGDVGYCKKDDKGVIRAYIDKEYTQEITALFLSNFVTCCDVFMVYDNKIYKKTGDEESKSFPGMRDTPVFIHIDTHLDSTGKLICTIERMRLQVIDYLSGQESVPVVITAGEISLNQNL